LAVLIMRWTNRLVVGSRSLFRRQRLERELDAELRFHLDQQVAENVAAGMSAADARAAALRSLGSMAYLKEECRSSLGLRLLDQTVEDLWYAGRTLMTNPAFTLIAVCTLALGIGANTTIFTLLDAVLLKPLAVPAASELVTFYENGPEGTADAAGGTGRYLRFSYPRFERLEQALGSHGSLAAVTRSSRFVVRLRGAAEARYLQAQLVSARYFATLGVSAARGRVLTADDLRLDQVTPVAVVSDGFWKRALGASDAAIGQTISVNGVSVTVVGVAPPRFSGMWTDSEADLWLPLTLQPALRYQNNSSSYGRIDNDRSWHTQDLIAWLNLVARVVPADLLRVTPLLQAANRQGLAELAGAFPDPRSRESMLAHTLVVESFSHGFSGLRARFSDALFALSAMVALVLLVTCANIANLLLARAAGRARDLGLRISLGATTGRLVRQCLTESVVLALLGGTAGVLLGDCASGFLARQVLGTSNQLPQVFSPDARVLAFGIGLSLVTAILFGLAPALRAIAAGRTAALGTSQRLAVGQATIRGMRSLVVGQLALSVVVVFAAMLLGRTLVNFVRIDPGFSTDRLVTASFDAATSGYAPVQMPALARRLVAAARTVPGVTSASASRCGLVAGCSSSSGFRIERAEENVSLYNNWVGPRYFVTVGIPLVSGREFDERDTEHSPRVAIVNESVAGRYFQGQSPIGRRLGFSQPDTEIVGVVRDARTQTLHGQPVPMVYFPIDQIDQKAAIVQTALTNLDVRVAGDAGRAVSAVRDAIRRAEPGLLLGDVGAMSVRLSRDLSRERIVAYLASGFGVLTLLLGSLGLYGVLSNAVARWTQEIGLRMALGARRLEVMALVAGQSVRLIGVGVALGLFGAAVAARYLSRMLFGVTPLDPATFLAVVIAFALVTALASYVPARRATRVDLLVALRCE
jgi:predicted permease